MKSRKWVMLTMIDLNNVCKLMASFKYSFTLLLLFYGNAAFSKTLETEFVFKDSQQTIKENDVILSAELRKMATKDWPVSLDEEWGVNQSTKEIKYIKSLKISIGNKQAILPSSSYSDLFNAQKVSIFAKEKTNTLVKIKGGDASTSYEANLYFDKDAYLVKREVKLAEFPDEVNAETTYRFNRGGADD